MASIIQQDPILYSKNGLIRNRTVLPKGLSVGTEVLGKGANNRVLEAQMDGESCVLRMPRRHSDTQQKGCAIWEFRHALKAAQIGVAPAIFAAWYAKHATREYPSGLYVVTERFDYDYERLFQSQSKRSLLLDGSDALATKITDLLWRLATSGLFLYDLKPSNVVMSFDGGDFSVKLIDFGKEFCEWAGTGEKDSSTPVIDMVARMTNNDVERVHHILFATMLVELAATTTHRLYADRRIHRMDETARRQANGLARSASALLDSMQGQNIAILREVLRCDDVKGVLGHYHGRRNAGTGRTLKLARGCERA